jgi:hypothetical protein
MMQTFCLLKSRYWGILVEWLIVRFWEIETCLRQSDVFEAGQCSPSAAVFSPCFVQLHEDFVVCLVLGDVDWDLLFAEFIVEYDYVEPRKVHFRLAYASQVSFGIRYTAIVRTLYECYSAGGLRRLAYAGRR